MSADYKVHGDVAVITMNNPPVNGLGHATRLGLTDGLAQANADAAVKAIVITGAGKAFSGGADIKEFGTPKALAEPNLLSVILAIENSGKPVVAAVHSVAMGGGLELALGCDIRIAAESAQLGLTESRIGAIPGAGGTQRLPRLIGISRALDMMYSGEPVTARRALEIGLVNACVADAELDDAVGRYVAVLGSRSPSAARTLKCVVYRGMSLPLADGLECERQALDTIFGSADYAEGLAAFAEKRPPRFSR